MDNHIYPMRQSLGVFFTALALTIAFHFTLAEFPFALSFAIFIALTVIGLHVVALLSGGIKNKWAYLFLIPTVLTVASGLVLASPVAQVLSLIVAFGSIVLFGYWTMAPKTAFAAVKSFWPLSFFLETFFPFVSLPSLFTGKSFGSKLSRILLGVVIALPILFIFGALFAAADHYFAEAISSIIKVKDLPDMIAKFIRDALVGIWFLGYGWTMVTRAHDGRHASFRERKWDLSKDSLVLHTILVLLNAIFLIFIGFQLFHFFGGQAALQAADVTYANYARQGFFQLRWVSGIVFVLSWVIYWMFGMKDRWNRILLTGLIAETGLVVVSAFKRLALYVDAYGLTLSRAWAFVVLCVIGLVLIAFLVGLWMKASYHSLIKNVFIGTLFVVSALCLVNMDALVARWNIDRAFRGSTKLDIDYILNDESYDAVPALVAALKAWPQKDISDKRGLIIRPDVAASNQLIAYSLSKELDGKGITTEWRLVRDLEWSHWREWNLSARRALQAIQTLKK